MVAALEAGAAADAPFLTLHLGKEPEPLDARSTLAGAWRYGALLRSVGVEPGDRVPLLMQTSADFVHALLGCMMVGAVPAPLASPMTFGGVGRYLTNLAHVIEDSGARVIVTTPKFRDAMAEDERFRQLLQHALVPEDVTGAPPSDPRSPSIDPTHTALLQYTSGTTGRPKGVVVSHRALVSNAFAIAAGLRMGPTDVGVGWLPLFHDMGLIGILLTAVCHPYPIHFMRPEGFVMRPDRWLKLVHSARGTLSAAPNFAYDLCVARGKHDLPDDGLSSWRVALNGSEQIHAATLDRFQNRFGPMGFRNDAMFPVYGMAENTLAVTFPRLDAKLEMLPVDRAELENRGRVVESSSSDAYRAVSVGFPVAGASVKVTDDEGQVVREGFVGEVLVSGASLMDGYYGNAEATEAVLKDGWLLTGDLGFMHRGRLYICGRKKELIIKGGRNVYPYDVERVAAEVIAAGGGVAAFARPNEDTGTDDLVVVAETREKDAAAREELVKQIRGDLLAVLSVKADDIHLWPMGSLPRTTSGKIKRAECRRTLEKGGPA